MAQTDVHDSGYATPGRCYAGIYNFCRSLLDADGSDFDLMESLRRIFLVFNPALDKIKSQMTVKTRFNDSVKDSGKMTDRFQNKLILE